MQKKFSLLILSLLMFSAMILSPAAHAGKVDAVQDVLRKECRKAVSYEEALFWVRALYLTCIPEMPVKIDDACTVKCMKPNAGVIMGR